MVTTHRLHRSTGAYLEVIIGNRKIWALMDTGGELTVIPRSLVEVEQIRPTKQQLETANGTLMNVVGETTIDAIIEDYLRPGG